MAIPISNERRRHFLPQPEGVWVPIIRGLEAIRQHPGCISSHATRCVEQPGRYMVTNVWTSLEAHTVDFRGGPLFSQWRSHINGLFEGSPEVFHYQVY